jgi:uncharacterized protein YndB with AHSA1/START domain
MQITVEATIKAPIDRIWHAYTMPDDILIWNTASPDWHTVSASADLRAGGAFSFRMEAKDGSMGFDFAGTYTEVVPMERIESEFGGRRSAAVFVPEADHVRVTVMFDAEETHPVEQQRGGWQAILDSFKRYVEGA